MRLISFILSKRSSRRYGRFAEFPSGWNNGVEGQVTDQAGNVVERTVMRLLSVDSPEATMSPNYEKISDYLGDEGKFRIYGVTPGEYLLAVEVHAPFLSGANILRTYYSQAKSSQNALTIKITETDKLTVDLKLPAEQSLGWITGVMVWSDGTPVVEKGWVQLEKLEDSEAKENVRYELERVDSQGKFRMQVFENAEYWVTAGVSTEGLRISGKRESRNS